MTTNAKRREPNWRKPVQVNLRTYNGDLHPEEVGKGRMPQLGGPGASLQVVSDGDGLTLSLEHPTGNDEDMREVRIEREPHGWTVLIDRDGLDRQIYVRMHDDGRTFVSLDENLPDSPRVIPSTCDPVPDFYNSDELETPR